MNDAGPNPVFVLCWYEDIYGVFSSRSKAEQWVKDWNSAHDWKLNLDIRGRNVEIVEYYVDEPFE